MISKFICESMPPIASSGTANISTSLLQPAGVTGIRFTRIGKETETVAAPSVLTIPPKEDTLMISARFANARTI